MGLDKTGFTLLENEYKERRRTINEAYQKKKSQDLAEQIKNLFSVGEQRKQDLASIERNYNQTHFEKEVTLKVNTHEREIFNDWGGSRDTAFKTMSSYEKELKEPSAKESQSATDQESEAEFKARMHQHFNERSGMRKNRGRD